MAQANKKAGDIGVKKEDPNVKKAAEQAAADAAAEIEAGTKALAEVPQNALATLLQDESMLLDTAGMGMEKAGADDVAVPFIFIIQSGSPEAKKSHGSYIQGAEEGHLINTLTKELFKSIEVIPVFFERVLIEWKQRGADGGGGGMVAIFSADDPIQRTTKRVDNGKGGTMDLLPSGNILNPHAQHYCLHVTPSGSLMPVVIAMTSTQLKKSRQWNGLMDQKRVRLSDGREIRPASFAYRYMLTTTPEQKQTFSWMGWKIEDMGMVESAHDFQMAKALYERASARERMPQALPTDIADSEAVGETVSQEPKHVRDELDDEIPF